jgi:hypothetical protein
MTPQLHLNSRIPKGQIVVQRAIDVGHTVDFEEISRWLFLAHASAAFRSAVQVWPASSKAGLYFESVLGNSGKLGLQFTGLGYQELSPHDIWSARFWVYTSHNPESPLFEVERKLFPFRFNNAVSRIVVTSELLCHECLTKRRLNWDSEVFEKSFARIGLSELLYLHSLLFSGCRVV